MKAAIYCRVSTARQNADDKVSMEDQEERCRAVCDSKGWEVVAVFDEGDASAGTAQRGEFQRMIAAAKAGEFDIIVAREVSRLSRVAQARRAIEELMIEWDVKVCNARTGMVYGESDGLGASVIWTIEAKMAEAELAERSFRTVMGMRGKAERGRVPGGAAPFGYHWTGGADSQLVPHEADAEVVRQTFEWVAAGARCSEVASRLNEEGVPSPGKSPRGWSTSTVQKIVRRTSYYGEHYYGRTHWRKLNSERDRQAWAEAFRQQQGISPAHIPSKVLERGELVYEISIPPLVDRALWDRANRRLTRTTKNRIRPKRIALLQGLLRCEECGLLMKSTWAYNKKGKPYWFYRCTRHVHDRSKTSCRSTDRAKGIRTYVSAGEVEGLVWSLIDGMLSDPQTLAAAISAKFEIDSESAPAQGDRIGRHKQRLERSVRAWDAARRAYFAEDVDAETYERDKAHYQQEIEMLREELARMQRAEEERLSHQEALSQVAAVAGQWSQIGATLTDNERREIVWALVTDVTISKADEVTVTGSLTTLPCSNGVVVGRASNWCSRAMAAMVRPLAASPARLMRR